MLNIKNIKVIDSFEFDKLVQETYGKPYCFQQQDDCQPRGMHSIKVPSEYTGDSEMHDEIPFKINGSKMGVKFSKWLETTVEQVNDEFEKATGAPEPYEGANRLFWERNFYPDLSTLINDLHSKGLIESGEYEIKIDW